MAEPLLSVSDLAVRFPVRRGVFGRTADWVRAVDGVSFEVFRGETLGLVGPSGCGKSTVARSVLGLVRPSGGEIRLGGERLWTRGGPSRKAVARRIQVVFQDPLSSLNPRHTVEEIVTEGAVFHGLCAPGGRTDFAAGLLNRVGIPASALSRYPHEFSGGQRQRIGIARALALKPEVLICDEAVSALDLSIRAQVLDLLAELKDELNLSLLFISHDLGVVQHLADRLVVMEAGRVVETGPAAEVLSRPRHASTRRLIDSVPVIPDP